MSIQSLEAECENLKARVADAKRRHVAHTYLEWRFIQTKAKLMRAVDRQERKAGSAA